MGQGGFNALGGWYQGNYRGAYTFDQAQLMSGKVTAEPFLSAAKGRMPVCLNTRKEPALTSPERPVYSDKAFSPPM